jgi:hypothetical protein
MKSMFCTSAPTGSPSGTAVAGTAVAGTAVAGIALSGWGSARLRAPEAFTAPYQGTGLPFGGTALGDTAFGGTVVRSTVTGADAFGRTPAVVDAVTRQVDAPNQVEQDFSTHDDGTTLGIHSSTRPPS